MSREREQRFDVRVGKDELRFAAAHFITFGQEGCEPLHGHNYRVQVSLTGCLNPSGYVLDFIRLKELVREVLEPWDHSVLLPTHNPRIEVQERGERVEARCGDGEYAFPRSDVRLLPIRNTTAELLACLICDRLLEILAASGFGAAERLEVEVEEAPGQSARYTRYLDVNPSPDRA
jgi:6-pyruvoyltetrahydropterin/6-carboxytetrahydropterin synthase